MAEWLENGGPVDSLETRVTQPRRNTVNPPKRRRPLFNWLDVLANWSLEQLVYFWIAIIVCFGAIYWIAGIGMGWGLKAGDQVVKPDLDGLGTALYFSFVTALSIGYGDVVPLGALRVLAVTEGIVGLLIFGCVISKLVSHRQEELVEEIHRTTFDERLDRVRTNLHLVFSDLETIDQIIREHSVLPGQVLKRLESSIRVFTGELKTIHDLLYRAQMVPDEDALESLLANLALSLNSLTTLLDGQPQRSAGLNAGLRVVSNLANEICSECVPRQYAPALRESMDQIKELAQKIV
jgi:hypothetical protein